VPVPGAGVTLHLGNNYYFLPADEAKRVLIEAWRNSPESVSDTMGLVFPAGKSFTDDTWSAVISYSNDGYVSDSDAKTADYGELISQERSDEGDINAKRKEEGLDPIHVVGWAQAPSYDPKTHTMVWARQLHIGQETDDTLNYDVRSLGRRGVLSMNMLSTMSQLPAIRTAAAQFQQVAQFDPGSRYVDYQSGSDKKAEYGLAGLVAAGIGVAVAQKLGFLGLALLFLKKAIVFVIAGATGALAWLRRLFSRSKPPATPAA
jgi:uncharacterized membrane-anchored protein